MFLPWGALLSRNERKKGRVGGIFSDRKRYDKCTNTQRKRGREGGKEQELLVISSPAPPPSPPASCRRCVPCSVRPLWEGLRHCAAAPSCIVWVGECVGCRELSQALCCQRMEPCISVPTHSPFLPFTAGSFLRPNTLSLSPHV